ncbi:MAG: hypothetical protein ACKPEN_14090 [Planktothrix sp.]|uniref:hypothetical protein n=1 Tax=Planktothrix sp. TaxID=3088171 RepID=UPI0038D38BD1
MSQTLQDLKTEWNKIKAEIEQVKSEYDHLISKRSKLHVTVFFASNSSPESLAILQEQAEAEANRLSFDLQQLDQEIKATQIKSRQIHAKLAVKQAQINRFQAQQNWMKLKQHCEKINQLANTLESEIVSFYKTAQNFEPVSEEWLPKNPQLLDLEMTQIPYVQVKDKQFKLISKPINFNQE